MYDFIIIGAGCAGLSAAIYGARAGRSVLVFESEKVGGQITSAHLVENYPGIPSISGMEFADALYSQAISYGAEVRAEEVRKVIDCGDVKEVWTDDGKYESGAVIIAAGLKHRTLGLEREKELTGAGVSYCAVCDGAFYKGNQVAVAGGGNTALSDAVFLSDYCSKVFLIHRRDGFRAEKRLVDMAAGKANIEFIMDSRIIRLNGDKSLNSVTVKNTITGAERDINIKGLFVAVGHMPVNQIFEGLGILNDEGYIDADETGKTRVSGIFAAGDCRAKQVRQLATAAADGINAALNAMERW